jgi:hypothetical protein
LAEVFGGFAFHGLTLRAAVLSLPIPTQPVQRARVKSAFRKLLLIACALHLSGAHWALLQAAAWTGMLMTRSQSEGVAEAVKTTFDGEHPCALCAAITAVQKEEKRNDAEAPVLKDLAEIKLVAMDIVEPPPPALAGELVWMEFSAMAPRRTDAPPSPPPLA